MAKATPAIEASFQAVVGTTGVRATAWEERIGRVNWGPSAAGVLGGTRLGGINHNPPGGRQRRRCGHSKQRSDRTIPPVGEPRATGLAVQVRSPRFRLDASPITETRLGTEIRTVTASKRTPRGERRWPWRQASLKPYWGKPPYGILEGAKETKCRVW